MYLKVNAFIVITTSKINKLVHKQPSQYKTPMDILTDKYLSPDEAKEIAYRVPPKDIISFCRTSSVLHNICKQSNFWINYVDSNQEKYNKLMIELARNGKLEIFKRLWGAVGPGISTISEPKLLQPAFEIAYLNGHEHMADYLYALLQNWKLIEPSSIKLSELIELLYDKWGKVRINKAYSEVEIFNLSLISPIENNDLDKVESMFHNIDSDIRSIFIIDEAISHSTAIESFNKIIKLAKKYNYPASLYNILIKSLKNGNFVLGKYLADSIGGPSSDIEYAVGFAFVSNTNKALEFARQYASDRNIRPTLIGNKEMARAIVNMKEGQLRIYALAASHKAFKAYDYVRFIKEYYECLNICQQYYIIHELLVNGEFYKAKVVIEEIPICVENNEARSTYRCPSIKRK